MKQSIRAVAIVLGLGSAALAEDRWTEFRGPSGTGLSTSTGLPREWSETKNVAWKTPIHGRGWSSPVVLGTQVWLTTATRDGRELSVLALDRDSGRVIHDIKLFEVAKPEDTARFNSFASPTPVIEDGRVYVHFGSYGTAALDTRTGQTVWARRDLPCNHWRGPGSSPMLYGELLIVHFDGYDLQYAVALDKNTGPHRLEVRPRVRLRHRRRRHEEGVRDTGRDRGGRPRAAHQPGGKGGALARPQDGSRAVARALRLALGRRAAALRARPRLRRQRARPLGAARDPPRRQRRRHGHARRLEGFPGHRLEPVADPGGRPHLRRRRQGRRRDLPRREDGCGGLAATDRGRRDTRPPRCSPTVPSTSSRRTARRWRSSPAARTASSVVQPSARAA